MIIDGRAIAHEMALSLKEELAHRAPPLRLSLLMVSPNPAILSFVARKKKIAEEIGVLLSVYDLPLSSTTATLIQEVKKASEESDGIVIQLPLPPHLSVRKICDTVPIEKDVDLLSTAAEESFYSDTSRVLPPVVGAIAEILVRNHISLQDKKAVVVGQGALVGKPVAAWLSRQGAHVVTVVQGENSLEELLSTADIVVSGAGVPGLIQAHMLKEGAVLFDGGTSEEAQTLKGDMDPLCAEKASLFTPVPGGIGPITVVKLFENLAMLNEQSI